MEKISPTGGIRNSDFTYTATLCLVYSQDDAVEAMQTFRRVLEDAVDDTLEGPVDLLYDPHHPDGPSLVLASSGEFWDDREEFLEWVVTAFSAEIVELSRETAQRH